MIRITVHDNDHELRLQLEGHLAGPCVDELAACWSKAGAELAGRHLRVDLRGVCRVDGRGRELMELLYHAGADFLSSGCHMPEVVREVAAAAERRPSIERIR